MNAALRRIAAAAPAGDARVWRTAALVAVPLVALIAFYCLRPNSYYTGTNNVEASTYIARVGAGEPLCVRGLEIPSNTARIRLQLRSSSRVRPALTMVLTVDGGGRAVRSGLPAVAVSADRISTAVFPIPALPGHPAEQPASLCLTASGAVSWRGTSLARVPSSSPPTAGGRPLSGRIAVWYLPAAGVRQSYLAQSGEILRRAALFRPGFIGPWLYVVILLGVLPALAFASVRCLALAAAGDRTAGAHQRRLAASVFVIAALNFSCWAIITPPFQGPDEVDHFAYTQSLVELGKAPARDPGRSPGRWASSEALALDDMGFLTDHQVGDSRPPWTARQQDFYRAQVHTLRPSAANGGGNETAATHGSIYYAALAPAYLLASNSPLDQLTLMRLTSALIGALVVLFTFLLARELAPGRPWLAVLAALLVAYEPMFGFLSGAVNNDIGVNAGAAALELLLIGGLRWGITLPWGLLTGAVLVVLPNVKGTAYSLYPVAAIALLATLRRHHRRPDVLGLAGVLAGAGGATALTVQLSGVVSRSRGNTPGVGSNVHASAGALAHPLDYLGYLWQVFLPRLPFMAPHFEMTGIPAFTIFVERGWGAFGWFDVYFPGWVYVVILIAMLAVPLLAVAAARREWSFVRRNVAEVVILLLVPVAVIAGFEAAFYSTAPRSYILEFGRYAFPAIGPVAVLVAASLHAFGRRHVLGAGVALLTCMIALSYASQLLTLTSFYA